MASALALRQVAAMLVGLTGIVRIPRELLYVGFDDLASLGVPASAQAALRALVADLPLVPDATSSAQLIGARSVALPCLAALARHVVQGLRDHNLTLAHDRSSCVLNVANCSSTMQPRFSSTPPNQSPCCASWTQLQMSPTTSSRANDSASPHSSQVK